MSRGDTKLIASGETPLIPPNTLQYDIRWIDKTFSSRTVTQSLLAPQLDNLNVHDYEAALDFLPGIHHYYAAIAGGIGLSLAYAFRKRHWNPPRLFMFLSFGATCGISVGRMAEYRAHLNFIKSLNNPAEFDHTLQNIQKEVGIPLSRGPTILYRYPTLSQDQSNISTVESGSYFPPASPTSPTSNSVTTQQQPKHQSRWDEIRASNGHVTRTSSWDALRQQHERTRTAQQPEDKYNPSIVEKDRATEQAEFEALLEKERNFK